MEENSDITKLGKMLKAETMMPTFLQKEDETWTSNSTESLNHLLDTHFPEHAPIKTRRVLDRLPEATPDGILEEVVSLEKIKWSIKSFKPFKAAGTDKIYPIMLQRADEEIYNILQKIFKACLKHALIPN